MEAHCERRGLTIVARYQEGGQTVSEAVQQDAGESLRAEDLGPLVEGQVRGDHDQPPLVSLAEDLEEAFRAGLGEWDEAKLVDDEQL